MEETEWIYLGIDELSAKNEILNELTNLGIDAQSLTETSIVKVQNGN